MIESEMFLNTTGFKSLNSIDEFKNGRKDEDNFFFDFFDILSERRGTSDILWASREWNPSVAYSQSEKLMGDSIKTMVLNSPHLKHKIFEMNNKFSIPINVLYQNAHEILEEIGFYRKLPVIRWFGVFFAKIFKKLYTSIYVNEAKFLRIISNMGSNPVLFLPTHRSYCDFILMAYICFHYEFDIPKIAAGIDFLSMSVIGNLLRDSCAFFMRRSFNNDELYATIFNIYVQSLVIKNDSAIEFFIEGTRSRTSKSLPPKYGLLSMALKPFFFGLVPDISIVPVNLSYDKVLEEILFAYELLGIPKPKESTKGFFKALSILNENYGNIYVNFGEPISLKEYFSTKIDRSKHCMGPVYLQQLSKEENDLIINLAYSIINEQRDLTVVNCFNLIASILNYYYKTSSNPLTVNELTTEVQWLFSQLKILITDRSKLALKDVTKDFIMYHLSLHKPLIFVSPDEKIYLGKIVTSNTKIVCDSLEKNFLSYNTLDVAVPVLILQNYVNPISHYFIPICFISQIVDVHSSDSILSKSILFREYEFLCSIFSYEFVIHNKLIKKSPGKSFSKQELLETSQKKIEKELDRLHPCNLSLDVLKNSLEAFAYVGAVYKLRGNSIKFKINEKVMKEIHSKLSKHFCFFFFFNYYYYYYYF
ncbi:Dihydroxyacetone phosphate acyltransferase, putative [Pediculus humanus corporis]|uniref:Dihydroxyacetone phosphate acyltransferase, putative n=1 Tax=Pediculus humanus subsp. corporis TaxID=121224 RepID=E0W059_PEDHC|nr:Dihydroxyacetone phosphate acyltransferase, putative [Pediculus humanus corporis]EEB19015.1 Dihydroxyacetone phosphate acyltransferase, putative [Pediculus humanus corporis]